MKQATECPDDVTVFENAVKKGSCVKDRKESEETQEAALGLGP